MDQAELKERTKVFALRVIKLVRALPKSLEGRTMGAQVLRSATSVAANYRAACRARSRAEFVAKIGVVLEEADETELWLELIVDGGLMPKKRCAPLHAEACELVAIMAATRKSTLAKTTSEI
jgi:four helix bundle protein